MLLDQTVFTVGPDSNIVLDEFIYDPFTDTGKVTAQVTKGVFRFVTGKVAGKKPADMKIKIPAGTIGIRGTFGAGSVGADGDTLVGLLGPGADNNGDERVGGLDIETGKDTQSLDEPGTGVIVKSDGDVSEPFTLTPEQTAALNAGGSDNPSGGSGNKPSDAGGGAADDGGDESASASAGQETALAAESSADAGDLGDASSDLGEDTNTASQAAAATGSINDGIASWDNVRTVESGQSHFSGSGSWNLTTCNSGSCANGTSGTMSFNMNIDFGARTVGGLGSSISGTDTDANAFGGNPLNASTTLDVLSFSALSGAATFTDVEGTCTAVISILNSGGNAATHASASLTYSDGTNVASGSLIANKVPGLIPQ